MISNEIYDMQIKSLINLMNQLIRDTVDNKMKWEKTLSTQGISRYCCKLEEPFPDYEFIVVSDGSYILLTDYSCLNVTKNAISINVFNFKSYPEVIRTLIVKLHEVIEHQLDNFNPTISPDADTYYTGKYTRATDTLICVLGRRIHETRHDEMKWEKTLSTKNITRYHCVSPENHSDYELIVATNGSRIMMTDYACLIVTRNTISMNILEEESYPDEIRSLVIELNEAIEHQLAKSSPTVSESEESKGDDCLMLHDIYTLHHLTTSTLVGLHSWKLILDNPTYEVYTSNGIKLSFIKDTFSTRILNYTDHPITVNGDVSTVTKQVMATLWEAVRANIAK